MLIHAYIKIYWTSGETFPGRKYKYGVAESENKIWLRTTTERHGNQINQKKGHEKDIHIRNSHTDKIIGDGDIKEVGSGIENVNNREPGVNNHRKESGIGDGNVSHRKPDADKDRKENRNVIQNSQNGEAVVDQDRTENDSDIHNLNNRAHVVDKDGKESGNDTQNPNNLLLIKIERGRLMVLKPWTAEAML